MRRSLLFPLLLLVLTGCGSVPDSSSTPGAAPVVARELLGPAPDRNPSRRLADDEGLLRTRLATLQTAGLPGQVSLELFDGRGVSVDLRQDGDSFVGTIEGDPSSSVVLTRHEEAWFGSLSGALGTYQLRWVEGDVVQLSQLDPASASFECAPEAPTPRPRAVSQRTETVQALATGTPTVDVYVVYTNRVLARLGTAAAVQARAEALAATANQVYANSGQSVRVNVVAVEPTSYTQANTSNVTATDLDTVANLQSVQIRRNELGADLVCLLVDLNLTTGGHVLGIAYCPARNTGLREDTGFSVVAANGPDMAFAHELGHNFGCQHNLETQPLAAADALYPFAFGNRKLGSWATVMAYRQGSETWIPYFSGPAVSYLGAATGLAGLTDNAQAIAVSAPIVASYRTVAAPAPTPTPVANDGSLTVSLQSGWNAVGFAQQQLSSLTTSGTIAGLAWWNGSGYQTGSFSANSVNSAGTRQGFWVFAPAAASYSYKGQADGSGNYVDLRSGWNLVSFPTGGDLAGSRLSGPLGSAVLPQFTEIQPGNSYATVDVQGGGTLRAGRAYWVFAVSAARLTW